MMILNRPNERPIALKKVSVATAVTISGIIKGSNNIPPKIGLYFTCRDRSSVTAASVAITVAPAVAHRAMITLFLAARWMSSLAKAFAYHSKLNPAQTVAERDALNENTTRMISGR